MHPDLHDYWPAVGSVWATLADAELATQLAALRCGWTGALMKWHSPTHHTVVCRHEGRSLDGCRAPLISLLPAATHPSDSWRVTHQATGCFDLSRHEKHGAAIFRGLAEPLQVRSSRAMPFHEELTRWIGRQKRRLRFSSSLERSFAPTGQCIRLRPPYAPTSAAKVVTCPPSLDFSTAS